MQFLIEKISPKLIFRDIMGSLHVDPEHAVTIHEDLRSQASIGIHWGTFSLAYEVSI